MEDRVRRYVKSLETTIHINYRYLKKTTKDFCEMCQSASRKGDIPQQILTGVRRTNKEIQGRFIEIKAIQDLLEAKYRQLYRRDPHLDSELNEMRFATKTAYSKLEYEFQRIQIKSREKQHPFTRDQEDSSFKWFRSKENQITLLRNLRILNDLNYQMSSDSGTEERREVIGNKPRSLTFFIFSGDPRSIEDIQSQMGLREHDIVERWNQNELRGVLTHLRQVGSPEIEGVLQRFMKNTGSLSLKCLYLLVRSQEDLHGDLLTTISRTLREMSPGEVRMISV